MDRIAPPGRGPSPKQKQIQAAGERQGSPATRQSEAPVSTSIELVAPPLRGPRRNTVPSALGGGRYEVLERIGEGGMAVVYRAFDRQLGRTVALKTVSELGSRELFRLKREFRVLADLQHRNLVQFHDLVVGPNQCFFTMELLSGDDFLTYVRGGPCTPPSVAASPAAPDTLDWERSTNDLETVCAEEASPALDHCQPVRAPRQLRRLRTATVHLLQGLRALHERGLVHRDVKPANVVVESAGRTVLVDFGLSRGAYAVGTVDGESDAVRVEGTAFYMAPEQAMGGEVGTPADVYSVGVMLYQLLSGRLPFDGSVARVLRRKCARDPDELERIVSGAPVELAELTMAMLSRDPAARPTVPEILSILEGGIGDESGFAMPVRRPRDRFVGREEELGALRAAFEESRELRQPRVLLLQGPSGMGKSALLDRFCRQLEGDAVTPTSRCPTRPSTTSSTPSPPSCWPCRRPRSTTWSAATPAR
jgi:serine/threonine protein kinase